MSIGYRRRYRYLIVLSGTAVITLVDDEESGNESNKIENGDNSVIKSIFERYGGH